jgi:hypothetical protein
MGRPDKLTPDRQQKLIEAIVAGNYYETACAVAGVDYSTFRRWMQRGEEELQGKYREFFEALTRAEAEAETQAVAIWQRAMPDDWRAAQMFLERRHPDRWGKQSKLDVKQEVSGQMEVQRGIDQAFLDRVATEHPELIDILFQQPD